MQPFNTLPYKDQLSILSRLAIKALTQYGLERARIDLLQYEDNAVYRITSPDNEYFVLRINAVDGHQLTAQQSEMQWLMALRNETNLAVPEPVVNHNDQFITTVASKELAEPRHCVLLRWVPGDFAMPGIQPAIMEQIGTFTAHLHRHSEHFIVPADFTRLRWDWQQLFGTGSVLQDKKIMSSLTHHQQNVLMMVSRQMLAIFDRVEKDVSLWGLIHGDLHRDNILIDRHRIGVIDFDDCGWGYYWLDIAAVLDSFYRRIATSPQDYAQLRDAYLAGYDRVRALPDDFSTHLRAAKVMRDMSVVNFMLMSQNTSVLSWAQQRFEGIIERLVAYLEREDNIGI